MCKLPDNEDSGSIGWFIWMANALDVVQVGKEALETMRKYHNSYCTKLERIRKTI